MFFVFVGCVSVLFLALVVCVPPLCVSFLFSCIGFFVSRVSWLVLCFLLWWVSLLGVSVPVCAVCLGCMCLLLVFVSVVGGVCMCLVFLSCLSFFVL